MAKWDLNKTSLCYWFDFYDMVFEHPERPPEDVIISIGKLDSWVRSQVDQAEKERLASMKKQKGYKHPASHQEVVYFGD